jgi:predicted RNA-binding Zn-ribbon protein involved in translation (DUF1610 family)
VGDVEARSGDDGTGSDAPVGPAESGDSDAFAALGNAIRLRALVDLLEDAPRSFSELAAASDADTTAGFAYHLRQLRGRYVRKVGDDSGSGDGNDDADGETGYVLTDAGNRVARAIRAGSYTTSVDRDPVPVEDPCPLCGAEALEASARDNTVAVACEACGRAILRLPFPPGGFRTHDDGALADALSRQYRHRVALMTDGGCPECGGKVAARIEAATPRLVPGDGSTDGTSGPGRALCRLACEACGYVLTIPVTLAVLDHPAVVAFYHEHGVDVGTRPVWNVGSEWRERVLSTDPWAVRVSTVLDGDGLALFVAGDARIVDTERFDADAADGDGPGGPA